MLLLLLLLLLAAGMLLWHRRNGDGASEVEAVAAEGRQASPWETFHSLRDRRAQGKPPPPTPPTPPTPTPPPTPPTQRCHGFLPCLDMLAYGNAAAAGHVFLYPSSSTFFFIETRDLQPPAMHRIQDSMLATSQNAVGLIVEPDVDVFAKGVKENRSHIGLANYQAMQSRDCTTPFVETRPPQDWPKTVVVIPSVHRSTDLYLAHTLASLDAALSPEVQVILINANPDPDEHHFLKKWCADHPPPYSQYICLTPEKVPEHIIDRALKLNERLAPMKKKRQTREYIRWRTAENAHAHFGLSQALQRPAATQFVWMQDDIIVKHNLFTHMWKGRDIICLRTGHKYCGAVAYAFSRRIVERIVQGIEAHIYEWPLDWIVDKTHGQDVKTLRQGFVKHIGQRSSSGRRRSVDAVAQQHRKDDYGKEDFTKRHQFFKLDVDTDEGESAGWQDRITALRLRKCAPMRDIISAAVATNAAENALVVVDFWSLNMQSTRGIIGALQGVDFDKVAFRAISIPRVALRNSSNAARRARVQIVKKMLLTAGYHELLVVTAPTQTRKYSLFVLTGPRDLGSSANQKYNLGVVELPMKLAHEEALSWISLLKVNNGGVDGDAENQRSSTNMFLFGATILFVGGIGSLVLFCFCAVSKQLADNTKNRKDDQKKTRKRRRNKRTRRNVVV